MLWYLATVFAVLSIAYPAAVMTPFADMVPFSHQFQTNTSTTALTVNSSQQFIKL